MLESDKWKMNGASKIGLNHLIREINNHDAVRLFEIPEQQILGGIICDGCSAGKHSEVGSNLIAEFASCRLLSFLNNGYELTKAIDLLFKCVNQFIEKIVPFTDEKQKTLFLDDYFMTTIMGVILSKNEAKIFHSSDGVFSILNKDGTEITNIINQNDVPTYITYRNITSPEKFNVKQSDIPKEFKIVDIDLENTNGIMIATDGFNLHNETVIDVNAEKTNQNLPYTLFGQQWNLPGKFGLKKWMNVKSSLGYFYDDATLIVIERKQ